ncbi:TIGR02269 family lipoprotein [Hyalangium minutum]|uniref:SitA6 family polymorphic toxin lipoprotein n=1 Tax=Hyalangium minutum TaxID=394096 RepID=UPI0006937548|nr:TIGR02269 family lipoprotein [Hyalangium minutum]
MRWLWLWAAGFLAACATLPISEGENLGCEVAFEAFSFDEACADESSLTPLCGGGQCGLYRCREVQEHLPAGSVLLTRGGGLSLPIVGGGAQRNWGSAQELPQDKRPVFIIPWRHKPPLLPSQIQALKEAEQERRKPHEKHHIFPQASREWFEGKKIDIDEYTIPLEVEKHRSIHRGERGGPWNAAWRKWIFDNGDATKEEIFRYAGQLIYEFELFGPIVPYWKLPPPLPPGY